MGAVGLSRNWWRPSPFVVSFQTEGECVQEHCMVHNEGGPSRRNSSSLVFWRRKNFSRADASGEGADLFLMRVLC